MDTTVLEALSVGQLFSHLSKESYLDSPFLPDDSPDGELEPQYLLYDMKRKHAKVWLIGFIVIMHSIKRTIHFL